MTSVSSLFLARRALPIRRSKSLLSSSPLVSRYYSDDASNTNTTSTSTHEDISTTSSSNNSEHHNTPIADAIHRHHHGGGGIIVNHLSSSSGRCVLQNRGMSSSVVQAVNADGVDSSVSSGDKEDVRRGEGGEEGGKEGVKRWKRLSDVPISEVLKAKHSQLWIDPTIPRDATIREAIQICVDNQLSAMMVVAEPSSSAPSSSSPHHDDDTTGHVDAKATLHAQKRPPPTQPNLVDATQVLGMCTSRDLLRIMNRGLKDGEDGGGILGKRVGDFMVPIGQVIYARPEETIGMCRMIMAKLGVKCLPILSSNQVEGLVTARDMSQFGLEATEKGGKKHYLSTVSERVGLSSSTSMAEPPLYLRSHMQKPLFMNVGVAELPHPFKTVESCGMTRRDFGPGDIIQNTDLSEDAHFAIKLSISDTTTEKPHDLLYAGVADGVGSWREYGVDPREFSHRLMAECENILRESSCEQKKKKKCQKTPTADGEDFRTLTPAELLGKAYDRVRGDDIIGSSTACVALFDGVRHQLHFSNLGDCGIVVLRHIDSNVAGALKRESRIPRELRTNDLRVNFVSQQQLRSFNHPYQLGWTGKDVADKEEKLFETADETCTSSIHIRRGDIIIMATDGLFDNVELEDVTKIALEWEMKNEFIKKGTEDRAKRWGEGSSMTLKSSKVVGELAMALVERARENSLDNSKDSPFAILAKENDVMWTGGMPDDCTVLAMHIVGEKA